MEGRQCTNDYGQWTTDDGKCIIDDRQIFERRKNL